MRMQIATYMTTSMARMTTDAIATPTIPPMLNELNDDALGVSVGDPVEVELATAATQFLPSPLGE